MEQIKFDKGNIVNMLDATGIGEDKFGNPEPNNLYGINLENHKYRINNYFKNIYAPIKEDPNDRGIFEDALEELLKPIAESREGRSQPWKTLILI